MSRLSRYRERTTTSSRLKCKARIVSIAQKHGAKVIDWRISSPLTSTDANDWDFRHYRVPIATRIAKEFATAVLDGRASEDGSYRILVP